SLPVALYLLTAIDLYADLLRRSVEIAKALEDEIFENDPTRRLLLTTQLDFNPLAGGKGGPGFYGLLVKSLYLAAAAFSAWYLHSAALSLDPTASDPWRPIGWLAIWLLIVPGGYQFWYKRLLLSPLPRR